MNKKTGYATLSPAERAKLSGNKNSRVIKLVEGQRVKSIVQAFADCQSKSGVRIELEDGTTVVPTIEEEIVYNALMQERDHSRGFQSLLDYQKLLGENEEKIEVNVSLVDQDLLKRALD